MVILSKIKTFIKITRANFLLATFIPLILSIVWSLQYIAITDIRLDLLVALILGTISCHLATNTFNDYFDWQSGTDQINTDYIPSISGGSRAIELKLITTKQLLMLATTFFTIAALCAVYITLIRGSIIIVISLIGGGAAYFYTAPPVRLVARNGLGEIFLFLCFGPLLIVGALYVLTAKITLNNFLISTPIGMLITSVLLINEVPDLKSDAITYKNNFSVTFGYQGVFLAIILLTSFAYLITIISILCNLIPKSFLLSLLTIPLAIYEIILIYKFKITTQRALLCKACINNLVLYTCFGISFIMAAWLA